MFRFFENLVDPFSRYEENDTPPNRLWPFLLTYVRPFRGVLTVAVLLKIIVASFEVALIWYVGRMVDLLSTGTPEAVWRDHGTEFLLAALVVLVLRTLLSGVDVALLHNTILTNLGALIR